MSNEWLQEFQRLFRINKAQVSAYTENVMSRRVAGEVGGEEEFSSYEMVILMIPLTPSLDQEKLHEYLTVLNQLIRKERYPSLRLVLVLFQEQSGDVVHYRKMWGKRQISVTGIKGFINEIMDKSVDVGECRMIDSLPPLQNIHDRSRHPNKRDLLVFLTDAKGCSIEQGTLELLKRFQRRCIWLEIDKDHEPRTENGIPQLSV